MSLSDFHELHYILPNIPIVLVNVECDGSETSLLQCSMDDNRDCFHDKELVIECKGNAEIILYENE